MTARCLAGSETARRGDRLLWDPDDLERVLLRPPLPDRQRPLGARQPPDDAKTRRQARPEDCLNILWQPGPVLVLDNRLSWSNSQREGTRVA